ncbi:sarcolemma associated protein a isoform X1 [Gadus macrocephalus]|uniref:sarcolemma associated protein a isoform X1 n=1 Tax=Gadus macrocephalus TaxID=80720 RepID=UPI0028CB2CF8|nr:sarcolemma associated protein a isoform X1 [Gadus macrocephalus]
MPSALAVFACRPNSHAFQERHVYLDEPVKIGRSVARCRPAQNNATFDCKVLSRNHALVWFDHKTGKFYLQDTKSSNGTFINSQRLSRGSEESPPCELLSGDIIQFGVDVTENTRKVTHGCIVSGLKLFLPDGMEARRRADVIQAPLPLPVDKVAANTPSMYSQELFQLSQYLQEALHREQMLEQKLATLQRLLANTQEASESSWQALIDEDRLLSRLEVMGSQLQAYSKSQTEEGIKKELLSLQEDKHNYETTAKESLRRVLQEKIEVVRKLAEVERSLSNSEEECTHLKQESERSQEEVQELANKYNAAVNQIRELADKIKLAEGAQEELSQRGEEEKRLLQGRLEEMEDKEQVLQARIEALQADNDFTNERLSALQVRLEQLQERSIKETTSLAGAEEGPSGAQLQELPEANQSEKKDEDLTEDMDEDTDTDEAETAADEDEDDGDNCHVNNSGGDNRIQQIVCSPVKQLKEAVGTSIHKLSNFEEVIDAHLKNNQTAEDDSLASPDPLRDAKESDMSDTLSPSKDRSSDDTSDGNMDDQDLNEPQNRAALLRDELQRAGLDCEDTEQVIHYLHRELLQAQDLANTGKTRCLELQALLEEERKNNSHQTEESTKQIQYLQSQLARLQVDMESLRDQSEKTICSTREELSLAQEEVLVLRDSLEEAGAEREQELSALQVELGTACSELEQWRSTAAHYQLDVETLQQAFVQHALLREKTDRLQVECDKLQGQGTSLQKECEDLRSERTTLLGKLQTMEDQLTSSRTQHQALSSSLQSVEHREELLTQRLGSLENQHLLDSSNLHTLLDQAKTNTHSLQKEYEETQEQLVDLRRRYEKAEQDKVLIHQELEQCRSSLHVLQARSSSGRWRSWMPVVVVMVAVTAAVLYPNFPKSSST